MFQLVFEQPAPLIFTDHFRNEYSHDDDDNDDDDDVSMRAGDELWLIKTRSFSSVTRLKINDFEEQFQAIYLRIYVRK